MANYDFNKQLSPSRFEQFAKDILEIREKLNFEIFGEGQDDGIDLRCQNGKELIIGQVKRYNDFNNLYNKLKQSELEKVKKLSPNRYILITSVKMLPSRKKKIKELFKDYIKNEIDIIGEEQLNSMLGAPEYHSVELNYYELWINSSNVMRHLIQREVNNSIYVLSDQELREIQKVTKIYVKDKTFEKALKKINKNKCLLICGEPGIGKTTLARNLCAYYMNQNREIQFICVENVEEVSKMFKKEKAQLFFMDDFWGSRLDGNLKGNKEKKLKDVIEMIKSSDNKILILTSREYVLNQGYVQYPELESFFDNYKLKMSIDDFSDLFKAQILFRHLENSDLPKEIISELAYGYDWIIHNENYSPRIIENYINYLFYREEMVEYYLEDFLNYLKHPEKLWKEVFEKQNEGAQLIAILLLLFNEPVEVKEIRKLFHSCIDNNIRINARKKDFEKYISQLENTIITTYKDDCYSEKEIFIKFKNSSIELYVFDYFNSTLEEYAETIIKSTTYLNNLLYLGGYYHSMRRKNNIFKTKYDEQEINLEQKLPLLIIDRMVEDFDELYFKDEGIYYYSYHEGENQCAEKLVFLIQFYKEYENIKLRNFLIKKINELIFALENKYIEYNDTFAIPTLIKYSVELRLVKIDVMKVMNDFWESIRFSRQLTVLEEFEEYFPKEYQEFIKDKHIIQRVIELTLEDAEYFMSDGLYDAIDELMDLTIPSLFDKYQIPYSQEYMDDFFEITEIPLSMDKANRESMEKIDYSYENNFDELEVIENEYEKEKKLIEEEKNKLLEGYKSELEGNEIKDIIKKQIINKKLVKELIRIYDGNEQDNEQNNEQDNEQDNEQNNEQDNEQDNEQNNEQDNEQDNEQNNEQNNEQDNEQQNNEQDNKQNNEQEYQQNCQEEYIRCFMLKKESLELLIDYMNARNKVDLNVKEFFEDLLQYIISKYPKINQKVLTQLEKLMYNNYKKGDLVLFQTNLEALFEEDVEEILEELIDSKLLYKVGKTYYFLIEELQMYFILNAFQKSREKIEDIYDELLAKKKYSALSLLDRICYFYADLELYQFNVNCLLPQLRIFLQKVENKNRNVVLKNIIELLAYELEFKFDADEAVLELTSSKESGGLLLITLDFLGMDIWDMFGDELPREKLGKVLTEFGIEINEEDYKMDFKGMFQDNTQRSILEKIGVLEYLYMVYEKIQKIVKELENDSLDFNYRGYLTK